MGKFKRRYYFKNQLYEEFSKAQDAPCLIQKNLVDKIKNKFVCDVGCGTGKYLPFIQENSSEYLGIDKSLNQLSIAKKKVFLTSNLMQIDLSSSYDLEFKMDVFFAAWFFVALENNNERNNVLENFLKNSNSDSVIYAIENSPFGEFYDIIKKTPKIKENEETRIWFEKNGFEKIFTLHSYFLFDDFYQAKRVFKKLEFVDVNSNLIEHNIDIYVKELK